MHLDNSTKLNLERNLKKSRPQRKDTSQWKSYEASEDDTRVIADPELEYSADRSVIIHSRKRTGPTEVLEGYGTTNFGMSGYEPIEILPVNNRIGVLAGVRAAGLLLWELRGSITSRLGVVANYALLLRESYRS